MTTSTDLFELIKSLQQSEKRYFKIFSSNHVKGGKNNYVRLFEAIDKQKVYNEAAILKQFKQEKFAKQFSVTKNYLYNFILKSLRSYYAGKNIDAKISETLESVQILYTKGLAKKALKMLRKIKQIAWDYEKHESLLSILKLEKSILQRYANPTAFRKFQLLYAKEIKEILKILANNCEFEAILGKVYDLYTDYMVARSKEELAKYQTLLEHKLLTDINNALSFDAKIAYNNIYGLFYAVQEDYEQAAEYDAQQLQLFEEYPKIKEDRLHHYLIAATNLLSSYLSLHKKEAFKALLKSMRQTEEEKNLKAQIGRAEKALVFESTYELELLFYLVNYQFQQGLALIPEVEKGLKKFKQDIKFEYLVSIQFSISKLYFYTNQLDEALDWISAIEFAENPSTADDILCFARLMKLLIYYDLGDSYYNLLSYELKSTRRFLQKKQRLYKIENIVLRYLTKLVNISSLDVEKQLWKQFQAEITLLSHQKFEQSVFTYLDLSSWLSSKIEKRPMQEFMTNID